MWPRRPAGIAWITHTIANLTNTQWREAQFFFTSRLAGEPAGGVPDIHFTPGAPPSSLGGLALRF